MKEAKQKEDQKRIQRQAEEAAQASSRKKEAGKNQSGSAGFHIPRSSGGRALQVDCRTCKEKEGAILESQQISI